MSEKGHFPDIADHAFANEPQFALNAPPLSRRLPSDCGAPQAVLLTPQNSGNGAWETPARFRRQA
jgi:hypothetical protein